MDRCTEVYEEATPPGPDPKPVEAPACNKTADCEDAGSTCCVYNYEYHQGGFDVKGMAVGCLSDYFEWDCLEEFATEDPLPPAPIGPTAPPCGKQEDCDES